MLKISKKILSMVMSIAIILTCMAVPSFEAFAQTSVASYAENTLGAVIGEEIFAHDFSSGDKGSTAISGVYNHSGLSFRNAKENVLSSGTANPNFDISGGDLEVWVKDTGEAAFVIPSVQADNYVMSARVKPYVWGSGTYKNVGIITLNGDISTATAAKRFGIAYDAASKVITSAYTQENLDFANKKSVALQGSYSVADFVTLSVISCEGVNYYFINDEFVMSQEKSDFANQSVGFFVSGEYAYFDDISVKALTLSVKTVTPEEYATQELGASVGSSIFTHDFSTGDKGSTAISGVYNHSGLSFRNAKENVLSSGTANPNFDISGGDLEVWVKDTGEAAFVIPSVETNNYIMSARVKPYVWGSGTYKNVGIITLNGDISTATASKRFGIAYDASSKAVTSAYTQENLNFANKNTVVPRGSYSVADFVTLSVVSYEGTNYYFINNEYITSQDKSDFTSEAVGFFVSGEYAYFDDISVKSLSTPIKTITPEEYAQELGATVGETLRSESFQKAVPSQKINGIARTNDNLLGWVIGDKIEGALSETTPADTNFCVENDATYALAMWTKTNEVAALIPNNGTNNYIMTVKVRPFCWASGSIHNVGIITANGDFASATQTKRFGINYSWDSEKAVTSAYAQNNLDVANRNSVIPKGAYSVASYLTLSVVSYEGVNYYFIENEFIMSQDKSDFTTERVGVFVSGEYAYFDDITVKTLTAPGKLVYTVNGEAEKTVENVEGIYNIDYMPQNVPAGKYFTGWYTDESCTTNVTSVDVSGETKLYAGFSSYPGTVYASVKGDIIHTNGWEVYYPTLEDGVYKNRVYRWYAGRIWTGNDNGTEYLKVYNNTNTNISTHAILTDDIGNALQAQENTVYKISLDVKSDAAGKFNVGVGTVLDGSSASVTYKHTVTNGWIDITETDVWTSYTLYVKVGELNNTAPVFAVLASVAGTKEVGFRNIVIEKANVIDFSNTVTFDGVTSPVGKIAETVEDKATYKVSITYESGLEKVPVAFMTAEGDDVNANQGFIEGKNYVVRNFGATQGRFDTHVAYVTIDTASSDGVSQGEALYMYLVGGAASDMVVIKVTLEKLTNDNGGDLLSNGGVSMIKDLAEDEKQALRYYFNYDTNTGKELILNGESFKIVSRGFLFANADVMGDALVTRTAAAKENSGIVELKTSNLTKCWKYTENGKGNQNLTFSTYVTGFNSEDGTYNFSKRLYVKGYIVVRINDVEYTFYSRETKCNVKEVADLQNFHGVGDFASGNEVPDAEKTVTYSGVERTLVWNNEFNTDNALGSFWAHSSNSVVDTLHFDVSTQNVKVNSGNLKLSVTDNGDGTYTFPSRATTRDKMSYKYGYLEIRAKVPFVEGISCSTFWLMPDENLRQSQYKGEIDVFETFGSEKKLYMNLHKWSEDYEQNESLSSLGLRDTYEFRLASTATEYHTYGFEWTEEYMKFYVDGTVYSNVSLKSDPFNTLKGMDCFNDFYYVILGNGSGGSDYENKLLQKGISNSIDYQIDYVRLYQNTDTEYIHLYQ